MRPAVAYRLKYRSSSQDSTEPLGVGRVARALEPSRPTETNETAELRALALEAEEIGRAARESRRRAAHMQLPPPHKLEELGLSSSGGPGLPVDVFKKLFTEGDKDAVVTWFEATGPRDINEGAGAQGTREDVERRPRIRVWSAKRRRLERPLVLAVLLHDQNPEQ